MMQFVVGLVGNDDRLIITSRAQKKDFCANVAGRIIWGPVEYPKEARVLFRDEFHCVLPGLRHEWAMWTKNIAEAMVQQGWSSARKEVWSADPKPETFQLVEIWKRRLLEVNSLRYRDLVHGCTMENILQSIVEAGRKARLQYDQIEMAVCH